MRTVDVSELPPAPPPTTRSNAIAHVIYTSRTNRFPVNCPARRTHRHFVLNASSLLSMVLFVFLHSQIPPSRHNISIDCHRVFVNRCCFLFTRLKPPMFIYCSSCSIDPYGTNGSDSNTTTSKTPVSNRRCLSSCFFFRTIDHTVATTLALPTSPHTQRG